MDDDVSEREMGFTRAEFFKQLPRTLSQYEYLVDGDRVTVALPGGSVTIVVGAEGERRFSAVVAFPVLPVSIRFDGVSAGARERFLHRFKASYQKGLG